MWLKYIKPRSFINHAHELLFRPSWCSKATFSWLKAFKCRATGYGPNCVTVMLSMTSFRLPGLFTSEVFQLTCKINMLGLYI